MEPVSLKPVSEYYTRVYLLIEHIQEFYAADLSNTLYNDLVDIEILIQRTLWLAMTPG